MRLLIRLLSALLATLALAALGFGQMAPARAHEASTASDPGIVLPAFGASLATADSPAAFDKLVDRNFCLKTRTYVVARDNPQSDVTHPRSYHECLPAWKFDLRTSQQQQPTAPSADR